MASVVLFPQKGRLYHDRLSSPDDKDENGQDVLEWKRLKASINARYLDLEFKAKVVLDFRARLFTIAIPADIAADAHENGHGNLVELVSKAYVAEMASYVPVAASKVFNYRGLKELHLAEWMISNPEHVAGLMHRAAEVGKRGIRREGMPHPKPLEPILERLFRSVEHNITEISRWHERVEGDKHRIGARPDFDTATWEAHRMLVLDLLDDADFRVDLVTFDQYIRTYARLTEVITMNPLSGHADYGRASDKSAAHDATRILNFLKQDSYQLGVQILRHAPEELKKTLPYAPE